MLGDVKLRQTTNDANGEEFFLNILKDKQKRGLEKIPATSGKLNRKCLRFHKGERSGRCIQIIREEKAIRNETLHYSKPWFKKSAVGVNKLNSRMNRRLCRIGKAGLGPSVKNHSGRKIIIQTLTNKEILARDIIQLFGHKNLESVTNYSMVSENNKQKCHVL